MIRQTMSGKIWPACDTPTQRLSKPRTNTSSSNLLALASQQNQPCSPLAPSEHSLSGDSVTVKASQGGDRRSLRKSRSKIREYLHGQSSDEDDNQKQKGTKRGVKERLSRSGSSFSRLANGNSPSLQHASRGFDDEKSERVCEEIREKAYIDSVTARNHVSEPIDDEDMHPDDMKSPIRRRSLYTPGLATRTPDDLLRKPPQSGQRTELAVRTQYNKEVPLSSPADDLITLPLSCNNPMTTSPNGRSTPTHFNQLGGLGLGTLRITNDVRMPSPEPGSGERCQLSSSVPGHKIQEDYEYFTASEGNKSEDDSLSMVDIRVRQDDRPSRRSGSPLKYESQWGSVVSQRQAPPSPSETSSPIQSSRPVVKAAPSHYDDPQNLDYFSRSHVQSQSSSPDRASNLAQDYMSELSPSPYNSVAPTADQFQKSVDKTHQADWVPRATQCPGMSTQDEALWAAEADSPSVDVWRLLLNEEAEARHAHTATKEDAYRILNGEVVPSQVSGMPSNQRFGLSAGDRDSNDRRESLSITTSNELSRSQGSSGSERASVRKATAKLMYANNVDSGYISRNASPKSLQGEPVVDPAFGNEPWPQQQRSISGPREMPQRLLRGTEAQAKSPRLCDTNACIRPTLEVVPRPQTSITTSFAEPVSCSQSQPVVSTIDASPFHIHSSNAGLKVDTSSRDSVSRVQQTSSYEQSATPSEILPLKVRKLQRSSKRRKAIDMTAVLKISEPTDHDIPVVPQDLALKHAKRILEFPTLDHTYLDLQYEQWEGERSSRNETPCVPIRFPSPANSIEERSKAIMRTDLDWPARSKTKKKAKELKAEQAAETKKRDRQGEALAEIADFGTVTNSIGRSPYDAARPHNASKPRAASNGSRCHPHQISTDVPRPKPAIGMDDPAAAEISRFRAQLNGSEETIRPQILGRANLRDRKGLSGDEKRPRSMFAGTATHALAVDEFCPGKESRNHSHQLLDSARPRSMFVDVPPVPTLPSANETQHLEAIARRCRQSDAPAVQVATSSDRPAELIRPRSMYDSTLSNPMDPFSYQTISSQRLHEQSSVHGRFGRPQGLLHRDSPVLKHSALPSFERSNTAICHGSSLLDTKRPQSTHVTVQRRNSHQDELSPYESDQPVQADLQRDRARLSELNPLATPSKLKKRRPQSAKADVWKSDSLRDKVKQGDFQKDGISPMHMPMSTVPSVPDIAQERIAANSSAWEATDGTRSKRRPSTSEAPLAKCNYGEPSANRFSRPVAALSLHDALRAHRENNPNSTAVSPLPSTAETSEGFSVSPISPLSTLNEGSMAPGEQTSYFALAPTRRVPPMPSDSTKRASVLTTQSTRPSLPINLHGIPVGDMDVFPDQREPALDGWTFNERKKRYEQHDISQPRTPGKRISLNSSVSKPDISPPRTTGKGTSLNSSPSKPDISTSKTPGKRSSLNSSPSKTTSPKISIPTAAVADSYTSHASSAPAPPAFSVHRKRLSSLSCFNPTPSARSLKPLSVSPEPNTPARRISTTSPSTSRTPSDPSPPISGATTGPTSSSNTSILAHQQEDGSPQKHANGLSSHPPDEESLSPRPTSSPPPFRGPIDPPTRFENLSGRYQGGLQYGYEPGVGLGGSAGTRVPKTGATRKSVDVGKHYGIDLSDIPIFLQHGPHRAPELGGG